jgi:hypothetical protein
MQGDGEEGRQAMQRVSLMGQQGLDSRSKTRLAVWLLMIRSRLRRLGGLVVWDRYSSPLGFAIRRPHSPIDRVLRAWMEGVVCAEEHEAALKVLLLALIDLLLHEARGESDYRTLFPFLVERINVHVERLLRETGPLLVGEMVFADDVAFFGAGDGVGMKRR